MGFYGVVDVEGGVGHISNVAVASSCEEVEVWGFRCANMMGKCSCVCLDVLGSSFECFVCASAILSCCGLSDGGSFRGHVRGIWEFDVDRD